MLVIVDTGMRAGQGNGAVKTSARSSNAVGLAGTAVTEGTGAGAELNFENSLFSSLETFGNTLV